MAQVGADLKLFYGATSGPASTEITNITDVAIPDTKSSDVKNTHYSTPDKVHDYLPGYSEGGEITVTMDFTKTGETTIRGLKDVRKAWKVQIVGDEGGDWQFQGYINGIGATVPVDDKLVSKFTIKVCSAFPWTPVSGA